MWASWNPGTTTASPRSTRSAPGNRSPSSADVPVAATRSPTVTNASGSTPESPAAIDRTRPARKTHTRWVTQLILQPTATMAQALLGGCGDCAQAGGRANPSTSSLTMDRGLG